MANDKMALFARKIHFESRWNELFFFFFLVVTPEMSHLGDQIKTTIRLILRNQENPRNIKDGENHIFAS